MKIKIEQLDEKTRGFISNAIKYYITDLYPHVNEEPNAYLTLGTHIRHGELLLCEYQDIDKED